VKYLLDTNICSFVIRGRRQRVVERFGQHRVGDLGISVVTLAELRFGADKSSDPAKNHIALDNFLLPLELVPFDQRAAEQYGKVRSDLESRGLPIGPLDTLIAAHALSLGIPLVTNNTAEFARVQGLSVEDWTVP
jgi:tRNA(fMet)-specific endonuclease VapC